MCPFHTKSWLLELGGTQPYIFFKVCNESKRKTLYYLLVFSFLNNLFTPPLIIFSKEIDARQIHNTIGLDGFQRIVPFDMTYHAVVNFYNFYK